MRNLPFSRDVPLYEQGTHRSGNAAYNVYPLLVVQYRFSVCISLPLFGTYRDRRYVKKDQRPRNK